MKCKVHNSARYIGVQNSVVIIYTFADGHKEELEVTDEVAADIKSKIGSMSNVGA